MSKKMIVSALAAVAAIAVIAAPSQDPSFEFPAAKHIGFDIPKDDPLNLQQGNPDRLSVSFKNATIREVLDWLKNQGINFVVGDDEVNKDSRININAVNQNVEDFMRALGRAWGGRWEKDKEMWVFKKGGFGALGGSTVFSPDGSPFTVQTEMTKEQREQFMKSFGKMDDAKKWEEYAKKMEVWSKDFDKGTKLDGKAMADLQKHMMELSKNHELFQKMEPGKAFKWDGKDFKPMDEKAMKEMHEHFEKMQKDGTWHMDEKAMKEMQEHFQKMGKDGVWHFKLEPGQKGFQWDGKEFKGLDEKAMKDMQKHFELMEKDGLFRYQLKPGEKGLTWDGKAFKPMDEKAMKELQKRMETLNKDSFRYMQDMPSLFDGKTGKRLSDKQIKTIRDKALQGHGGYYVAPKDSTSIRGHNLKAIYDSLTPVQESKLKSVGYINYSDLNSKQRALLGVVGQDTWTITYKTDKANLTIKSDR